VIERVVLSPNSTSKDAEAIRTLLNESGLENIPIESSRYEKELALLNKALSREPHR
jgi:hypothetical protein